MQRRELLSMLLVRRKPLASLLATYCVSVESWPEM